MKNFRFFMRPVAYGYNNSCIILHKQICFQHTDRITSLLMCPFTFSNSPDTSVYYLPSTAPLSRSQPPARLRSASY